MWNKKSKQKQNLKDYYNWLFSCDVSTVNDTVELPEGCPESQEWCRYTPAMTVEQFLLGFALTTLGYPVGVTLIQTIFSKILGSRPQVYTPLFITFFNGPF